MSMAERTDLDFAWRLNRGLRRIASAQSRNDVLLATARTAHELAQADGLCALPENSSQFLVSTVDDANVFALESDSPLQRLVASAVNGKDAIVQHRPQLEVELPTGRRLRAETLLTVPLGPESGYLALGFFWRDGVTPSTGQLSLLPGIAWTSCLALRSQQRLDELRETRHRQRSQLTELQHRARNVLALVRSIIRRSGDLAESQEDFASHLEARISALARTLGALTIDGDTGPELEDLVRAELIANAAREAQFAIAGPSLRLSTRAAETIALTLHELTTNSLKFGALTAPSGRIHVSWTIEHAPAILHWRWQESGVSIVQSAQQRRGFGRELIERVLPYELGATTRFTIAPGGVHCEIDLPLNERTAAGARPQEINEGELV
jgi:two-component sensor histidine kinase